MRIDSSDKSETEELVEHQKNSVASTFRRRGKDLEYIRSRTASLRVGRDATGTKFVDGRKSIPSTFFRRGKDLGYIRPGSTFRRVGKDNSNNRTVETACVESIGTDHRSIPHVRFRLSFSSASRPLDINKGTRMLSLESFSKMYPERVGSLNS